MSETNNFISSNLSIPEDAFEQFQVNSMYEEEEYITLSDILSPEPSAPELPSDICEIPYDNEVVLSGNEGPNLDSLPGTATLESVDSTVNDNENNDSLEITADQAPDQISEGRPKRARKNKSYVDDFVTHESNDDREKSDFKTSDQYSLPIPRKKRGRKPKKVVAQNEMVDPDSTSPEHLVAQKSKRGRKKVTSRQLTSENLETNNPVEELQNTLGENLAQAPTDINTNSSLHKRGTRKKTHEIVPQESTSLTPEIITRKRGKPKKKPLDENVSNTSEQLVGDNNCSDELKKIDANLTDNNLTCITPKKRPGRPRKPQIEQAINEQLKSNDSTLENSFTPQELHENIMDNTTNSNETLHKKPGKLGRKKKVRKEETILPNFDDNESEDELDNVSLKTLSTINEDNAAKSLDSETTTASNVKIEKTLETNGSDDIDVGEEDNVLNDLKEINDEPNIVVQDMELDETVETFNSELNYDITDNKIGINENGEKDERNETVDNSLLLEDVSKRPTRRRVRKVMHYDEGSDEDPFANIELSDDEPGGKKRRYYSDDEYIPGSENKKGSRNRKSVTSEEDSDISEIYEDLEEDYQKGKRKRLSSNKTTRGKKIKQEKNESADINVTTIVPKSEANADDIEVCLQSSVIQANNDSGTKKQTSVFTNEFESFLAQKIQGTNIKIKKVTSEQSSQNTPLKIPVLDLDSKKSVEVSVQTNIIKTTSTQVQTNVQHELPMKDNVALTSEQSIKACEFLKSIVKTTSELGQLMTEKSEDFITKKINVNHVTDTFKMDYCVKKSFLLLKLAKHNIVQMEDDLAKQYEDFLKQTNLIAYRQAEKIIKPTEKDSDSDCEIIEETKSAVPQKQKPKFNPKTVFLNKELSIKIAKKPAPKSTADKCKETLNIKNKNQVWISNTVMVKKVKPTQSFLAQDSRNKKPPDNFVTEKMVSDFFDTYYKKMASSICAPFTSTEWQGYGRNYVCNYFFVKPDPVSAASSSITDRGEIRVESRTNDTSNENNAGYSKHVTNTCKLSNPLSLLTLCTTVLKKQMQFLNDFKNDSQSTNFKVLHQNLSESPSTLFQLCLTVISEHQYYSSNNISNCINENARPLLEVEPERTLSYAEETEPVFDIHKIESRIIFSDDEDTNAHLNDEPNDDKIIVLSLKTMCFKKLRELIFMSIEGNQSRSEYSDTYSEDSFILSEIGSYDLSDSNYKIDDMIAELDSVMKNNAKSLSSLCVEYFQKQQWHHVSNVNHTPALFLDQKCLSNYTGNSTPSIEETPDSLKTLTFNMVTNMLYKNYNVHANNYQMKNVIITKIHTKVPVYKVKKLADLCFKFISAFTSDNSVNYDQIEKPTAGMTINCVNTLSEEAFHNIEEENLENDDDGNFYEEDNYNSNIFEHEEGGESNWESQLQLQEFKPCIEPNRQNSVSQTTEETETLETENTNLIAKEPVIAQVKLEPLDETPETLVDSTIVKTETIQQDQMTIIPESIVTKQERAEDADETDRVLLQRQDSSSFDIDTFERFVSQNKMMHSLDEPDDDIFTQSGLKVRRQHEPDYMNEYDPSLNLLIPQTFEPLSVVNAKGVLMASSDEESGSQKVNAKKKAEKKGRGRPKKCESKQQQDVICEKQGKETVNSKQTKEVTVKGKVSLSESVNEVTMLTRRMREKIRQEEKKVESSDSESESVPISRKKEKPLKENDKIKTSKTDKIEIQCSNVDSTAQIDQNDSTESVNNFTGFSTVDQNEISSYQKYVKFVYDKILPKDTESNTKKSVQDNVSIQNLQESLGDENEDTYQSHSPLINYDEPAEMLECEPTMPIFDNPVQDYKQRKRPRNKSKAVAEKDTAKVQASEKETEVTDPQTVTNVKPVYTEQNGWHCYPIDPNETKLYQNAAIFLEKLPESFVETYFEYQEISHKQVEDKEVDRLINLNTLNRSSIKEAQKLSGKRKDSQIRTIETSRTASPTSDACAELTASEDEGANVDDEVPPPVASRHANENSLAKNSLMGDSDSDSGLAKVKDELNDDTQSEDSKPLSKRKSKGKATKQSPAQVKSENPESLMLTADKMMNKELNLLHAPVVLGNETQEQEKGPSPKNRHRRGLRAHSSREHMKNDEDSSSEEEKQWVSTKEKLLKRLGKKQDTTSADDAKRAKLVTEFIERRGVAEARKRGGRGRGRRRNSRKVLEREKQMRVLSHELFGTPVDESALGTRQAHFSQSYFKGRRNIRKVIDKKSLARSTVIANMEEFERKCQLNQRQAQLRELLGCEEGVNVLVINDEVCLEYSFEEQRPVVSVHPFFTKVMKAHQYEGVKFMWDACFETLEKVESGHPGGGCILAHCMGLGKTLQVLALLHTVLTHPRVGMQRILVCCPLSTVLNWVDEIHKWIGPVTDQIKVFELSKLKKTYERAYQLEDWYSGGGIFIIGYELFRSLTTLDPEFDDIRPTIINKIRTALLDPGPDIIVCDEGHLLKNDCSVLAVAMSRVATKRRIVLTGTPMQNNLREYYCMVNFVKPNLLGTYSEYSNRFENPIMNGQHRDSREEDIKLMKQRTHILHKVLEGCLQRQEASVLYPYLPKKHEYTVFISLTKVQWDLYKHYINNYSNGCKQSVLKDFHMLQKIWSHPQVLHNFQTKRRDEGDAKIKPEKLEDDLAHEDLTSEVLKAEDARPADVWWLQYLDGGSMLDSLDCSNKFVVVFKILDECIALGDKVLIFSTSLFTMDALEYFLKKINKWSLGQEYYRLDGSVPPEVRQKWCREFNAEHNLKTKLFLISTRAGSLGLNMVAANRVIILDTSWNPAHDIQSIFRVYRFGQKKDCYIYRLVALGTMEQKIYERSVTKQAVSCRVVDEQQIDRHYNMAELTELYKYDELGLSVSGGVAVGVTDVALLRVARLAALHAVHEHDSLLRGSSEQQLPEHERAAAWMQFQQEHAHKQMQNQLTSSFSLNLPVPLTPTLTPQLQTYQELMQGTGLATELKTELPNLLVPRPAPPPKKPGRKRKNQPDAAPGSQPAAAAALAIQENMSKQIMNILIRNNFQNRQGPQEIAELVGTVRKIVAYGYVPKGSFDKRIAQEIADVLLMKEPAAAPPPPAPSPGPAPAEPPPPPPPPARRKGRPRKQALTERIATPPPQPPPVKDYSNLTPGRRRAAINAEKQFGNITELAAVPSEEEDRADEDWHYDSGPEEIVPEAKPQKKTAKPATPGAVKTETQPYQSAEDSILLSDDDEPAPAPQPPSKKTSDADVTPLHPSLLNNKNFIKIIAHTYLEGNPMLDEDAATLAAQYSTLKAKKEVEATGKPITSGPIYDIAVKVLGIDILKKLHKTNPTVKIAESNRSAETPDVARVKVEPTAETRASDAASNKADGKKKAEPESKKPATRLKAKRLGDLTGQRSPAPAPPAPPVAPVAPAVVPVGLIHRQGNTAPSVTPVAPPEQFAPPLAEESILPDDDQLAPAPAPASAPSSASAPAPKTIFKKNAKPLILNSVLAARTTRNTPPAASTQPKIPKLVISAGKLLPAKGFPPLKVVSSPSVPAAPAAPQADTICLDSDEEAPPEPKPKKRVAVKSTAKPAVAAAPAPAPAPVPVPVSITAANPQLNALLHQPQTISSAQLNALLNQQAISGAQLNAMVHQSQQFQQNQQYLQQNQQFSKIPPPQVTGGTIALGYASPGSAGTSYVVMPPNAMPSCAYPPANSLLKPAAGQHLNSQASVYQHAYPPQNIATQPPATQTAPVPSGYGTPTPAPIKAKTVCKPGDILRITKSGQIEVLNRGDEDVSIVDDHSPAPALVPAPAPAPSPVPANPATRRRGRPPAAAAKPPPPAPVSPPAAQEKPKKSRDSRNVSPSSSSGSDDSRPTTPEDPLSILKDVVHIKAPEEESPRINPNKTTMVGNTSVTKATRSQNKSSISIVNTKSKEQVTLPSKTTAVGKKPSQSDILKQISKTDTILKKLDKALAPNKPQPAAAQKSSLLIKPMSVGSIQTIDTIDLDSYEKPANTKTTANKIITKLPAKICKPSTHKQIQGKPPSEPPSKAKVGVSKVVGTSKDIIISFTGKSASITNANSGAKSTRVTSAEKAAPVTYTGKKRPAPAPAETAPQKKKTTPMTLKDFNIDDIDDIIELE